MSEALRETKVVQYGEECHVIGPPTERETCQAHVANVASALLTYLEAELPRHCPLAHFTCFRTSGPPRPEVLQKLLKILGWSSQPAAACLHQYSQTFPKAQAISRAQSDLPACDAWAAAITEVRPGVDQFTELWSVVAVLASFLVAETECERNFSAERRQFDHRPKLSPATRFSGLKCMVDGVPLSHLVRDGAPVSDFFQAVQARYADRHGSRFLLDAKKRKDAGEQRRSAGLRGGKQTLSSIQRERRDACRDLGISCGPAAKNVFGFKPVVAEVLDGLRRQERSKAFAKVTEVAKKKLEKSRQTYVQVIKGRLKSLCSLSLRQAAIYRRKYNIIRSKFSARNVAPCNLEHTWHELLLSLGSTGDPLIFADAGVLTARWREKVFGGKPLQERLASSLKDFVAWMLAPCRRIILVKDAAEPPADIQFAALAVGARVQESLFTPCVRYIAKRREIILAFTLAFAQAKKSVVALAKSAHNRGFRVVTSKQFWERVDPLLGDGRVKAAVSTCCFVYLTMEDDELKGLSAQRLQLARSFDEFMRSFGKVEPVRDAVEA